MNAMSDRGFSKHFDGRRFYNPGAPQARGFLDVSPLEVQ